MFITLSPVLIVNGAASTAPLALADALGFGIFAAGISIEAVADWQKDAFRSRPENKGRFITEGLWSWSRHPNYFGECLLWYVYGDFPAMSPVEGSRCARMSVHRIWVTFLSRLTTWML